MCYSSHLLTSLVHALMPPLLRQKLRIVKSNTFLDQLQKTHPVALKDIRLIKHSSAFQRLKYQIEEAQGNCSGGKRAGWFFLIFKERKEFQSSIMVFCINLQLLPCNADR